MSIAFRPIAAEVGCLPAEIFKEIRRCLRLRGGVVIDGVKWIWKRAAELAERLGCHEKTIRRHLKTLVAMGWLKREQHQKKWGMRAYHYCLGDRAPLKPVQSGSSVRTEADISSSSINRNNTPKNSPPDSTAGTAEQPKALRAKRSSPSGGEIAPSVPQHWPEAATGNELAVAIENARNLAFSGRRHQQPSAGVGFKQKVKK